MILAEKLWNARVDGTLINPSEVELPTDESSAYAIQDAVTQVADANIIGFKLGATSEAAISTLGVSESFYGPLFDRFSYRNGDEVTLPRSHKILLEVEIAVGMDGDLPPRSHRYSAQDVEAAVAWISPAFELVATRFNIELAGNGRLLIADGGVNAGFVLGDKVSDWGQLDLTRHPARLFVNNQPSANGHSGLSLFGSPFEAVAWLANHNNLVGRGLKAGDIITTGTCTGMTPIESGDEATANLERMGELTMKLVSRNDRMPPLATETGR